MACVLRPDNDCDSEPNKNYKIIRYPNLKQDLTKLGEWLLTCGVERGTMESTGIYWRSAYDILTNMGLVVDVINARNYKALAGFKTDAGDSHWLAALTRTGLLKGSRILPKHLEELRSKCRERQNFVDELKNEKNRVYKILINAGFQVSQVVTDLFGVTGMIILHCLMEGLPAPEILHCIETKMGYRLKAPKKTLLDALEGKLSDSVKSTLTLILASISFKEKQIAEFDKQIAEAMEAEGYSKKLQLLQTIPGVSETSARILLAELGGDVSGFKNAKRLASWAGMCPGNNESANKRGSGRTTQGNKYLRRILCEISCAAVRTDCFFKGKYHSLNQRRGRKRSIVAIGHKILKVVYYMLTRNEPYRDLEIDFQELSAKKNASRWIKNLIKYELLKDLNVNKENNQLNDLTLVLGNDPRSG
jgi:transposase